MPYWTYKQEMALMAEQGKPIMELAEHFHRSIEAVRMKIRRRMLVMFKTEITHLQALANRETDPAKKARLLQEVKTLQEEVQKIEELGVKEPSTSRRQWQVEA